MISQGKILLTKRGETYVVKFLGDVSHVGTRSRVVDLTEATAIDSTSLGMLAKISIKN